MKRTVITLAAVAGFAAAANAQVFDIQVSSGVADVSGGPVTIDFSLWLDTQGNETGIDVGGAELVDFFGWSGINGVFRTTAGSFNAEAETDSDAAGGTVLFGAFPGTVAATDWRGRRPGIAAVNGSDADFGPPFGIIGGQISDNGNDGSFRFSNVSGDQEVRDGGLTLGTAGGENISGAQSPTAVGGSGQNTDSRIEVFRGSVTFDAGDEGLQTISFDGLGSFFVEAGLTGFTSVALSSIGGEVNVVPTPASVALLGLGGLAAARRRR
ncbi:MAG: hypothetical protein AAGB51_07580 [Planctomycetota bacterium]